jgi:hypothetical protein
MPDNLRSRRVGVRFIWRCARAGMLRTPLVRRLVYRRVVGAVPVVRKRMARTPDEIMRAAAVLARGDHEAADGR